MINFPIFNGFENNVLMIELDQSLLAYGGTNIEPKSLSVFPALINFVHSI